MDRTRAAAWASGVATVVLAVLLFHFHGGRFGPVNLSLMTLPSLVVPLCVSLALAMSHSALARAALAVACALPAYAAITTIKFYVEAEMLDVFAPSWERWLLIALSLVLFPAAILWAARPGGWQTLTLRAVMGAVAILTLVPLARLSPAHWDASLLPGIAVGILMMVPPAALAIGLRPFDAELIEAS